MIKSADNKTKKFLTEIEPGVHVETTYVDYPNKHIICFSSMAGCPIGCQFCVSGQNQTYRILTVDEMVRQCEAALPHKYDNKPILFSCMGEGEPLLNYDNVVTTLHYLVQEYPNCKLALSTSGAKPHLLEKLAKEEFGVPFKVQISIHSAYDHIRSKLMPNSPRLSRITKFVPWLIHSDKELEFNYVLLDGINDKAVDAVRLAGMSKSFDIPVKLNKFNKVPNIPAFEFTTNLDRFCEVLDNHNVPYEFYETNGDDIDAACGQLSYKTDKKKVR